MFNVGVLGCGRVSQRHLEVFRDEIRSARVIAAFDPVTERAKTFAGALGAEVSPSMTALVKDPRIDVVLILTESGNHATHSMLALNAGKHVIVEKPAALLQDEVAALNKTARDKKLMYAVIFQNRYNPAIRALTKAYRGGRFGKIVLATIRLRWCRHQSYYEDGWHGTWKMDGGVINQQGIHHLDALQWICGPIRSVVAAQTNALNRLEAEDTTVCSIIFEHGGLGAIEATTAARPEDFEASISVVGEKGIVVIDGIALNKIRTWRFIEPIPEDETIPTQCSQEVPSGYGLSHGLILGDIFGRLERGVIEAPVTPEDGARTLQLVHAIYSSVETQGWVHLADNPVSSRLGLS